MISGWSEKKLQDVCKLFTDGNWIESKDQSTEGIRLIQTGNIGQGEYREKGKNARYISEETFRRLKCTEIFPIVKYIPEAC
jgi:type I restriction enzyme, S subunit